MIRTDNLEVTYSGETRALQPCSLRFEPGAFTVLLGASGAGKSTLLRALNGLVHPDRRACRRSKASAISARGATCRRTGAAPA